MEGASGDDRSQAPGLHRRDLGQNQYDSYPRPMRQRSTPRRQSALRQMADPHLPGGFALRRSHRALRHRRTDQWHELPRLCRAGSRAPRRQSHPPLPARLPARPPPDRTGLRQNEDPPAQGRRPNNRRDLANHRRPARLLHAYRMRQLLQECRICFSLTRSRSSRHFTGAPQYFQDFTTHFSSALKNRGRLAPARPAERSIGSCRRLGSMLSLIASILELWNMPDLLVRGVDDAIVRALKERAGAHGRSAEAEHRALLKAALARPHRRTLTAALGSLRGVVLVSD